MGWGTRQNFERRSKLLDMGPVMNHQQPVADTDKIVEGSIKLAAAIWRTGRVYRQMTPEEKAEFERYAAQAVRVHIEKKK